MSKKRSFNEMLPDDSVNVPLNDLHLSAGLENSLYTDATRAIIVAGPDSNGKYEVLLGKDAYTSARLLARNDDFSEVNCRIIPINEVDDTTRELCAALDAMQIFVSDTEGEAQNSEKSEKEVWRFYILDLLYKLVESERLTKIEANGIFSHIFGVSDRYTRMYASIYKYGVPELKEAAVSAYTATTKNRTSGDKNKVRPIVARLASLSQCPAEDQHQAMKRINAGEDPTVVVKEYEERKRSHLNAKE